MKKIIIRMIILLSLIVVLLTGNTFAKYRYLYEFDAMNLSYIKPEEKPFTNIIVAPQMYSCNITLVGLDGVKVRTIGAKYYFAERPNEIITQNANVRYGANVMNLSISYRNFASNINTGTLIYELKFYDFYGNLLYEGVFEEIIT